MHCTGELYSSSRSRGIWKAPLIRDGIDTREWHITSGTTWDSRMNLFCTLVIDSAVTLTMKDTLVVYGNQKIIVKQGGHLVLDGGTMTTECGDLWQGIEVWGRSDKHQFIVANGQYYQGRLTLKNNATIQYANEAITVFNPNDGNNGLNTSGGIVKAVNSTIRNVQRGAQFIVYENYHSNNSSIVRDNQSYFINCTFETTETLPHNILPTSFVTLWQVRGIRFNGCTFQNNNPNPGAPNLTGKGIYSENAHYTVQDQCTQMGPNGCTNPDSTRFRNLWVGVWGGKGAGDRPFTVKNSVFESCQIGLIGDGVNDLNVNHNHFIVGMHPTGTSNIHVGLDLINSITNYTVSDNYFKVPDAPLSYFNFGIWNYNTGVSNKTNLRNHFKRLYVGIDAEKLNRNPNNEEQGLYFYCNEHINGDFDFYVTAGSTPSGVKRSQGGSGVPAGNVFSNNGNTPAEGDFYNHSGTYINYYYKIGQTAQTPVNYSTFNMSLTSSNGDNPGCTVSSGGGTKSLTLLTTEYVDANQEYQAWNNMLAALIDGGSTTALKTGVNTATYNETMALRLDLLGKSPYLSEEVLRAAADKTEVLPESILLEILLANPDALKNGDLMKYLEEKAVPLPQWMLDVLEAGKGQVTMRTLLESGVSYYSGLRSQAIKEILTRYEDTDSLFNPPEIRGWYALYGNYQADLAIVESFIHEGNYTAADDFFGTIAPGYRLTEHEQHDLDNYGRFLNFYIRFRQNGKHENQLDSAEVNELEQIANLSDEYAGSMRARSILNFFYGYTYWLEPALPVEKSKSLLDPQSNLHPETNEHLDVYPVPATGWVSFSYQMKPGIPKAVLEIINTSGILVYQVQVTGPAGVHVADISAWAPGIYSYRVTTGGEKVFAGMIVVN